MPEVERSAFPSIRRRLLAWFDQNRRDLPWRQHRNPYAIWVSEVMLQQTQVATVIPYYRRFLRRFPNVRTLAAAGEQEVLRFWEGLGYYRRAQHLHQAARMLVVAHGDRLPDDPEIWRRLPGVGRYILGAVLSQAFGRRLPIVEANSLRVLCRLFGQTGDPRSTKGKQWLWNVAAALMPAKRCGDFNQAIMELGALVCKPVEPQCATCPLAKHCAARRRGIADQIPQRPASAAITPVRSVAVVIWKRDRVLLLRRPARTRWAGMWEFPHNEMPQEEVGNTREWLRELTGIDARIGRELMVVRHAVTRYRVTLVCLEAAYLKGTFRSQFHVEARWLRPQELHDFPISSAQRKLAQLLSIPPRFQREYKEGGNRRTKVKRAL